MATRVGRFESNGRLDVIRAPENPDWIGFATDSQMRPVTVPPLASRMDAIARIDDLPSVTRLLSGKYDLHGRQFSVAREQLGISEEMRNQDFYLVPTEFGLAVYSRKGEGNTLYPVNSDPLVPPSHDVLDAYRGNGISIEDAGSSRPSLWVEQRAVNPSDVADYLVQQGFSPRIARTLAIGGGLTFVAALASGCITPVDSTATTDQPDTPSPDTPIAPKSTSTGGAPTIVNASPTPRYTPTPPPTVGPTVTPPVDVDRLYTELTRYHNTHDTDETGCVLIPGDTMSGATIDYLLNTLTNGCYAIYGPDTPLDTKRRILFAHLMSQIPESEREAFSIDNIPVRQFREEGIYGIPGRGGGEGALWVIYNPTPVPSPTPDPNGDPDGDGITTYYEQLRGTDPFLRDTDGDGRPDNEFGEIGEYTRVISGTALIKAQPWGYLSEADGDPNTDLHQYHEVLEQTGDGVRIRFIKFVDVNHPLGNGTPLDQLPSVSPGSRTQASPESTAQILQVLERYNTKTDIEVVRTFIRWVNANFQIGGISHEPTTLNGRKVDGFTKDNYWTGEELFQRRQTEACGSHGTLTSYLLLNSGVPTRIVHSIPVDGSGPNHFTNETMLGGRWIPVDLTHGDGLNYRDSNLLKLVTFKDFGDTDLSQWDWYFANMPYWEPTFEEGMKGLYEITSLERRSPVY